MPRGKAAATPDHATLQMALVGYEVEKARIEGKIRDIQGQLGMARSAGGGAAAGAPPQNRNQSPAPPTPLPAPPPPPRAAHPRAAAAAAKAAKG